MSESNLLEALNAEFVAPASPAKSEQAAAKQITAKMEPRTQAPERVARRAEREAQAQAEKAEPKISRSERLAGESEGMTPDEIRAEKIDRLDAVRPSDKDALSRERDDEEREDIEREGDQYDKEALAERAGTEDDQAGIDPLFRDPSKDPANPYDLPEETDFVDRSGKKYTIPRELVEGALRQADYTRSKQELAEIRRNTVATQQMLQIQSKINEELAPAIAQVHNLRQLNESDRQKYPDVRTDPVGYLELDKLIRDREVLASELERAVAAKRTEYATQQQSVQSELLHSGIEYLKRVTKGNWNQQVQQQVGQYTVAQGFTPEELTANFDPRFVLLAYKAMQYDRTLQRQGQQSGRTTPPTDKRREAPPAPMVKQRAPVPTARTTRDTQFQEMRSRAERTGHVNDAGDAIAALLAGSARRRR